MLLVFKTFVSVYVNCSCTCRFNLWMLNSSSFF